MNYFNISLLIGGVVGLFSAILVYSKNKNLLYNRAWFWLNVFTAIWSFGYFIMITSNNHDVSWYSNWALHFAASLIPSFFLFFVVSFVDKIKKHRIFLILSFVFSLFFLMVTPSKLFIKDVIPKFIFNYVCDAGVLYIYFTIFFLLVVLYSLIILSLSLRSARGILAQQIKHILLTSIFGFAGGGSVFFLTFNVNFPPYPIILFSLYPLFVTYAITRYRLFNIKYFITRSILYTLLVALVTGFFASSTIVATNYLGLHSDQGKITVYILNSFLVVIFLDPIKRLFARITDKIFYKDKIDYQILLQEAGNIIAKEIDLKILSEKLSSLLSHRLKIKHINVFGSNFKNLAFYGRSNVKLGSNLVDFLGVQRDIIITEELIRDIDNEKYDYDSKELNKITDQLQVLNIEMVIPVLDDDKLIALLLLSDKHSGDLYNEEDINFFQVLVPQIASAFEKSQLYEEVQKFNVKLKKEVHQKTRSLQEVNEALEGRNKFLTTMQVVTNMISRTLDMKQVMQMIADSISVELGYVGGILSFVDEDKKTLRVKAFTNIGEIKVIWSTLPKNLKSYKAKLEIGNNLGVDTVLNGRINYSDNLSDFLCPPADEEVIGIIQEALKIKTIVGVPIYSEDRVIGLIHFLLPFAKDDVSPLDEETMTAMTNQVGILSRNLSLYDNLHSTNKELQEANVHLRALDKAKSEFVSIASHQLRTPISAIKGYLSMLIEGDFGELSDSVKDVAKGLFESSSRLARLVNTFLNVSRIESGRLKLDIKPVQVNDLIVGVIKELGNEAEQKGLKLTYKEDTDLPKAMADSDKLREVILNLIDNSIKYTLEGWVKVSVSTDDKKFIFQVKDSGIGIDPIEAKGLFRKFVRGSGVAQIHTGGSGLGLFIAQRIIKEHHGKIWAESKGVGKGSAFKFEVPIAK